MFKVNVKALCNLLMSAIQGNVATHPELLKPIDGLLFDDLELTDRDRQKELSGEITPEIPCMSLSILNEDTQYQFSLHITKVVCNNIASTKINEAMMIHNHVGYDMIIVFYDYVSGDVVEVNMDEHMFTVFTWALLDARKRRIEADILSASAELNSAE